MLADNVVDPLGRKSFVPQVNLLSKQSTLSNPPPSYSGTFTKYYFHLVLIWVYEVSRHMVLCLSELSVPNQGARPSHSRTGRHHRMPMAHADSAA